MIIQCDQCKAKFRIDDSRIQPIGSRVRCSKCGNVFFAAKEEERSDIQFSVQSGKEAANIGGGKGDFNLGDVHIEEEKRKETSFEPESFSQSVEKSIWERETTPKEKREIPIDIPFSKEGLRIDLEKEKGPIDGFDQQEFININEEGKGIDTESSKESVQTREGAEKREAGSWFSWEKLVIDKEPLGIQIEPPKLFNEPSDEVKANTLSEMFEPDQKDIKPVTPTAPVKQTSDRLVVDTERLSITKRETSRIPSAYATPKRVRSRWQNSGGNAFEKISLVLLVLFILAVIIGAGVAILMNLELIPKTKADKFRTLILSKLPRFTQQLKDEVVVSDHSGRWISTRNGLIYVVSGHVTNKSKYVLNYIRLKSEFISDRDILFEQVIYAGNILTDSELKTLSLEDVLARLNRKNGNIDFGNPKKLAGLNYAIQSGESVPFFAIFPFKGRILGLKYNIEVEDFEKTTE